MDQIHQASFIFYFLDWSYQKFGLFLVYIDIKLCQLNNEHSFISHLSLEVTSPSQLFQNRFVKAWSRCKNYKLVLCCIELLFNRSNCFSIVVIIDVTLLYLDSNCIFGIRMLEEKENCLRVFLISVELFMIDYSKFLELVVWTTKCTIILFYLFVFGS